MTNDKRFIIPEEKHIKFNEKLSESEFNEYLANNFFYFKDGKLQKSPCSCTCQLENWTPPEDKSWALMTMKESYEVHIQNEIKKLLEFEKTRIEKEVREKYPKLRSWEESSTSSES